MHSKSKAAFKKNVETEMKANPGKSHRAQNLAIAYNTQRMAGRRSHKMAKGGMAGPEQPPDIKCAHGGPMKCHAGCYAEGGMAERPGATATGEPGVPSRKPDDTRLAESDYMGKDWDGGPDYKHADLSMGPNKDEYDAEQWVAHGGRISERAKSIADAIMSAKKKAKMMADGGEVDLDNEEDASPLTTYEDDNADTAHEDIYDDDPLDDQPEDSNEHGDSEEDDDDMISKIRKRMKGNSKSGGME